MAASDRSDSPLHGGTKLASYWTDRADGGKSMHKRKQKMANLSDGIIALPGGCGTLEELLEIITWKQLGLYLNPIIILNTNRFFDPLLEMLEKAIDENFMRRPTR